MIAAPPGDPNLWQLSQSSRGGHSVLPPVFAFVTSCVQGKHLIYSCAPAEETLPDSFKLRQTIHTENPGGLKRLSQH